MWKGTEVGEGGRECEAGGGGGMTRTAEKGQKVRSGGGAEGGAGGVEGGVSRCSERQRSSL